MNLRNFPNGNGTRPRENWNCFEFLIFSIFDFLNGEDRLPDHIVLVCSTMYIVRFGLQWDMQYSIYILFVYSRFLNGSSWRIYLLEWIMYCVCICCKSLLFLLQYSKKGIFFLFSILTFYHVCVFSILTFYHVCGQFNCSNCSHGTVAGITCLLAFKRASNKEKEIVRIIIRS